MSYGNITDARAYHILRGNEVPADEDDDVLEAARFRASDYIRTRYVIRYGLEDDDPNVIEATYIALSYELTTPGFWSTTFTTSQIKVLTKVDAIQWTPITGDSSNTGLDGDSQLPTDPAIHSLLTVNSRWGLPAVTVV